MSITKLSYHQHHVFFGFFIPLLFLLTHAAVFAQHPKTGGMRVSKVDWKVQDGLVIINYDLTAPLNNKYKVNVALLRETDPSFKVIPMTIRGDIGSGKVAGVNLTIYWDYKKDFPKGFIGDDYYFEITVDRTGGKSPWPYFALGAGLIGGGTAALLLGKAKDPPPRQTDLPTPPARP